MDLGITGRVAIVTGASQGIGEGIAEVLAREGANLVISARRQEQLDEIAARLKKAYSTRILSIAADLRSEAAIQDIVSRTVEHFGRIDILVNNAGLNKRGGPLQMDEAAFMEDQQLRPFGYIRACRAVLPYFVAQRSGVIVNNLGYAGRTVLPDYIFGSMTVGGLINYTKMLAEQVARDNIRVVGVHPGPIDTPRLQQWSPSELQAIKDSIPLGRLGTSVEVGEAVAFLASDRASFITGTCLMIDGGAGRGIV